MAVFAKSPVEVGATGDGGLADGAAPCAGADGAGAAAWAGVRAAASSLPVNMLQSAGFPAAVPLSPAFVGAGLAPVPTGPAAARGGAESARVTPAKKAKISARAANDASRPVRALGARADRPAGVVLGQLLTSPLPSRPRRSRSRGHRSCRSGPAPRRGRRAGR